MLNIESLNGRGYKPETLEYIIRLVHDSTTKLVCAHGDDDPVVGLYEVSSGCVALLGVEVQPLCMHHRASDGSFEGMVCVVDLSLSTGWLEYTGDKPDFSLKMNERGDYELAENE